MQERYSCAMWVYGRQVWEVKEGVSDGETLPLCLQGEQALLDKRVGNLSR